MRYLVALAIVVAGLGLAQPAEARSAAVGAVRVIDRGAEHPRVVLRGRIHGSAHRVTVERIRHGRWVEVRHPLVRDHRFRVRVWAATGRHRFRVSVPGSHEVVRVVRPVPTDACGKRPRKPDGTRWSCTLDEEFSGDTLDSTVWNVDPYRYLGGLGTHACTADDPSVVGVAGGSLNLSIRPSADPVPCTGGSTSDYVAGEVSTARKFSQQYGRFQARIRVQAETNPGLHEAFWLWPVPDPASTLSWPDAGEIDVVETRSLDDSLAVPFLHYSADSGGWQPGLNTALDCVARRGEWNTYTLVWTPRSIRIAVNGSTCLVNRSGDAAFDKPYYLLLTQGMGRGRNAFDGSAQLPATMNVDYVRVWE